MIDLRRRTAPHDVPLLSFDLVSTTA